MSFDNFMGTIIKKMFSVSKFSELEKAERDLIRSYFNESPITQSSLDRYEYLLCEDEKLLPKYPDFTEEEIGYRRGYSHGVSNALRGKVTTKEVLEWIRSGRLTGAPGSSLEKVELRGLTKEDQKELQDNFEPFIAK